MRARTLNGYWCFVAPPGFRYEIVSGHGKLRVRDEPLASIITEALEWFANGHFASQSEIKQFLESEPAFAERFPTGYIRYEEIYRLLTRPHYAGHIEVPRWNISLRKWQQQGLISSQTFTRIQEKMKASARATFRKDVSEDFPLRGFVTCADCDAPLTSCWSKSKAGQRHPYDMCFQKGCTFYRKSIRRDVIEGKFTGVLQTVAPPKQRVAVAARMFATIWDTRSARAKQQAA